MTEQYENMKDYITAVKCNMIDMTTEHLKQTLDTVYNTGLLTQKEYYELQLKVNSLYE